LFLLVGKIYRFTLENLVQEDKGDNPMVVPTSR